MCLYGFCLHFYLLLIVLFLNASKYCRSVLKNDFVVVLAVADELSKLYSVEKRIRYPHRGLSSAQMIVFFNFFVWL